MSCYTEHKEWEGRVEDDGVSYNYEQNQFNLINLSVEKGKGLDIYQIDFLYFIPCTLSIDLYC